MATKTKPLTNTEVKQAKPKEKVYKLYDGDGLQLRVMPNGSKTWLLDYKRPYTRKRTALSLGSYPEVSLADARKRRIEAKELLANDIDPQEHRDEAGKGAVRARRIPAQGEAGERRLSGAPGRVCE